MLTDELDELLEEQLKDPVFAEMWDRTQKGKCPRLHCNLPYLHEGECE